jgi:hypothetical protein
MEGASHKRPQIVGFYLYELYRKGKSVEAKKKTSACLSLGLRRETDSQWAGRRLWVWW